MGDIFFPHLNIRIESLDRVAFTPFGFNIYWYGIFVATGTILGILLVLREAKRTGQSSDIYSDFAFIAIISGICCARLYYLIFHGDSLLDFFKFRNGGLAIYGGIIGGVFSAALFARVKKIRLMTLGDTCILGVLMGQIFGRWGNFFNREAFGRYTDSLFAMALKADTVSSLTVKGSEAVYMNKAVYPVTVFNGISYIQVHPTFLYECTWNILLFILIFSVRKYKKFEGQLLAMYCIGYGTGRFFIESLRTDQLMIGSVPVSMIVSAFLVAAGIVIIISGKKYQKNKKTS